MNVSSFFRDYNFPGIVSRVLEGLTGQSSTAAKVSTFVFFSVAAAASLSFLFFSSKAHSKLTLDLKDIKAHMNHQSIVNKVEMVVLLSLAFLSVAFYFFNICMASQVYWVLVGSVVTVLLPELIARIVSLQNG